MRKNLFVILVSTMLLLCCGCSSKQWKEGTPLSDNHSLSEQFSQAPEYLDSLLPDDPYTKDVVEKLSGTKEYELLIDNYQLYGRYDGVDMIVWDGAEYFFVSDDALCLINYGVNQAVQPECFEIYSVNTATADLIASSLDSYIIDSISDGTNLYVLCSDGKLLCIDENKSIIEVVGVFNNSVHLEEISLSGNSSELYVVDASQKIIWSENIKNLL